MLIWILHIKFSKIIYIYMAEFVWTNDGDRVVFGPMIRGVERKSELMIKDAKLSHIHISLTPR